MTLFQPHFLNAPIWFLFLVSFFPLKFYVLIYLFLAVLGLHGAGGLSLVAGRLFVEVHGPLIAVTPLVEHRL